LAEEVFLKLFSCTKPVVAAIGGHCVAGGLMTAMAADYRIGLENPKIRLGMSEIKIGLAMMPTQAEVMRFGLETNQRFRDVMFFGKMYDPMEAYRMGLIDEIADKDSLLPRAKAVVAEWIDTPGRPFIELKWTQRKHAIRQMVSETAAYDWETTLRIFLNDEIKKTLSAVQKGMDR
jgi:enoyl-CoA hydratase/carnithine racemase